MKIIFIPGLLLTSEIFVDQIEKLSNDFDISIANTMNFNTVYSMAKNILEKDNEKFVAIGLSMGGYVCMELARLAPHRLLALGLLSTGARADTLLKKKRGMI